MSSGQRINLRSARIISGALISKISPLCHRVEAVGSVRRRSTTVGDLELIVIPKWEEREAGGQAGLFGDAPVQVNLLHEFFLIACLDPDRNLRAVKPGREGREPDEKFSKKANGKKWTLWFDADASRCWPDLQIEIYLQTPETWGLNKLIRTGPADFGQAILARWKSITIDGYSKGARLHRGDGAVVDTPREKDVFRECRTSWIAPIDRKNYLTARSLAP